MDNFSLVKENNFIKAREEIKKNKDRTVIFSSNDDELNRKILEKFGKNSPSTSSANSQSKEKIDILLLSQSGRKDQMKQRNSGFNHVLAKIAKKNDVIIGINFDEIIESKGKNKAEIFGRIAQNIKLCGKNKLKMKFLGFKHERDIYDLKSLGLVLGMPTWMVKSL